MPSVAPFLIAGLSAILAIDYAPSIARTLGAPASLSSEAVAATVAPTAKGDRLAVARAESRRRDIVTVEVVGLQDAAVVYRDRAGQELFRTDPQSNVTVVAKGVRLPAVTIKQFANSATTPLDAVSRAKNPTDEARTPVARNPAEAPRKLPIGCEPSFSPVASPSMAHHSGRCMAALDAPVRIADLRG